LPFTIRWEPHGAHVEYAGDVTMAEVRTLEATLADDERLDSLRYLIIDGTVADRVDYDVASWDEIAATSASARFYNRSAKAAFVASDPAMRASFECFIAFWRAIPVPWEIGLFVTLAEARAWLDSGVE
jgi:hypothetical protein